MATPTMNRPTPERIFNTLTAYQMSAALRAGIDVDVFSAVAEGATTPAALAQRTGASERGLRILCDYLTILGFLTKKKRAIRRNAGVGAVFDPAFSRVHGKCRAFLDE